MFRGIPGCPKGIPGCPKGVPGCSGAFRFFRHPFFNLFWKLSSKNPLRKKSKNSMKVKIKVSLMRVSKKIKLSHAYFGQNCY